jgi:MinD-like ATPase involved in chromosome partitioning or flagellar assembly
MSIVAVTGDRCTTTSVALAAAWPAAADVVLIEADPKGGDLAAWFDMPVSPSLSTVVTSAVDGTWPEIERLSRLADNGIRLVPAPAGAGEAAQAVTESARAMIPTLAALRSPIAIVDCGSAQGFVGAHPFVDAAAATVVVHRQATQSARAAAVRLQRLGDHLERCAASSSALVVAVAGDRPFGAVEIAAFVRDVVGDTPLVVLPDDDLAAAVFGGRAGVSARRLARLPLLRAARELAGAVDRALAAATQHLWRTAR